MPRTPLDAAERREAWRAAEDICIALGVPPDLWFIEDMKPAVVEAALREGVEA